MPLIKIYFAIINWYFIPRTGHYINVNTYCLFYEYLDNCTCYCRCFWNRRKRRSFYSGSPPPKDEGALKKWSGKVEGVIKRLVRKDAEVFPAIVGSVGGTVLSF